MNRTVLGFGFLASVFAWACSGDDATTFEPVRDSPTAIPAATNGNQPAPAPAVDDGDLGPPDGGAAVDAAPSDSTDAGMDADSDRKLDAAADAPVVQCVAETEPNDVTFQQMPRSLCGKLTAGDVDRFYIEGRQDEPIELIFSADGDAQVTFKTNAGLSEAFFGKSFKTTVKPGDRKLFIEVSLAKASVAYHVTFERK
jgi:hypothetical protein